MHIEKKHFDQLKDGLLHEIADLEKKVAIYGGELNAKRIHLASIEKILTTFTPPVEEEKPATTKK